MPGGRVASFLSVRSRGKADLDVEQGVEERLLERNLAQADSALTVKDSGLKKTAELFGAKFAPGSFAEREMEDAAGIQINQA
jgi:hypothetical protein